jgi:hypothetical protein
MIMLLWQKGKKYFLPDIIFLAGVVLSLVLGLILFVLSHLLMSGGTAVPGSPLSLTILAVSPTTSDPTASFLQSVFTLHQNAVQWLDRPKSILDFTDPVATYDNPAVQQLWGVMLFIADSIIGIFIVLAGYQIIFAGLSARYGEALEALPNLLFAAIGANISLLFASFWIDLNNLLCSLMLAQLHVTVHPMGFFATIGAFLAIGILAIPLIIFSVILVFILGCQMVARLGVLLFLTVMLPLLFVFLANPKTQRYGQAGISAYVTGALVQFLQIACLTLGTQVLVPFTYLNIGPSEAVAPVISFLAGLAVLWLTIRIPGMLRSWALSSVAESGSAARSLAVAAGLKLLRIK